MGFVFGPEKEWVGERTSYRAKKETRISSIQAAAGCCSAGPTERAFRERFAARQGSDVFSILTSAHIGRADAARRCNVLEEETPWS